MGWMRDWLRIGILLMRREGKAMAREGRSWIGCRKLEMILSERKCSLSTWGVALSYKNNELATY
jgi:hypothetical protein